MLTTYKYDTSQYECAVNPVCERAYDKKLCDNCRKTVAYSCEFVSYFHHKLLYPAVDVP